MISAGEMTTYYDNAVVTYMCDDGFSQQNTRDIICTCDVTNAVAWSCSIPDLTNECLEGWFCYLVAITFTSQQTSNIKSKKNKTNA